LVLAMGQFGLRSRRSGGRNQTSIWHFRHILGEVRIGRNCSFGQNVMIGPWVTVGNNCNIQNNVSLYAGVTLEDDVFKNVVNPRSAIPRKSEFKPRLVKRGATIGANATSVCGHAIGSYAFIAAGAVVAEDAPDFALVMGIPARRVGWISHHGERLNQQLVCPATKRRYRETAPNVAVPID
jgi:UDP-2-acetamido-3-amino-2,3-dideoxy-glucuronate N-acetyltransferase